MFIREIIKQQSFPLLSQSPLKDHDIYALRELDLTVFINSVPKDNRKSAEQEVKALLSIIWSMVFEGKLAKAPRILYFKLERPRISFDDFCKKLDGLPKIKRYALLFALDNQIHIDEAVKLVWDDLERFEPLSSMSSLIIEQIIPHIGTKLVFFELDKGGNPMPIRDMNDEIRRINDGLTYPPTLRMYQEAIKNNEQEAKKFKEVIQELYCN